MKEVVAPLDTRDIRVGGKSTLPESERSSPSRGDYRNIAPRRRINRNSEIGTAERWDCLLFFYVEIVSVVVGPVHFVFHNGATGPRIPRRKRLLTRPPPSPPRLDIYFSRRGHSSPFFSGELKFNRKKPREAEQRKKERREARLAEKCRG
jgi:hypothetical protein